MTIFTPASCSAGMGDGTGVLGLQALGSPHGVTLHVMYLATRRRIARLCFDIWNAFRRSTQSQRRRPLEIAQALYDRL